MSTGSCARCGQQMEAEARFCPSCGVPARAAESLTPVRKHVCVLFVDIVDSTGLAENTDPELLRIFLARYFDRISEVVWQHGGTVEKFIGDAVMAAFGVPVSHEDDALRALRAATQIVAEVSGARLSEGLPIVRDLAVRAGVNAGEVFVTQQRDGQFSITGDAVHVAARLQARAGAGQICVSQTVAALMKDVVELEFLGEEVHRGKSRPEGVYRLVGLDRPADRTDLVSFVGREADLHDLNTIVDRVADRKQGWLVTLVGDAGLGKSRLVDEFTQGRSQALVLRASTQPTFTITRGSLAFVEEILSGLGPDWSDVVGALLGADRAEPVVMRLESAIGQRDAQTTVQDVVWALARVFTEAARERCLILVWDDLHTASEPQLDLILSLVQELRQVPALTIALGRPELFGQRPWWGGGPRSRVEHLDPLTRSDLRSIADEWHAQRGGDRTRFEQLAVHSDGNPMVMRMLLEAARDGAVIPVTVQALYEAALDRLTPPQRAFCESGAVLGRWFPVRGARSIMQVDPDVDLTDLVSNLCALNILDRVASDPTAPGESLRFTQSLLMQTAYRSMPKQIRSARHVRAAEWLIAGQSGVKAASHTIATHFRLALDAALELQGATDGVAALRERAVYYGLSSLRDQVLRGDPGLGVTARRLAGIILASDERLIEVVFTLWLHRSGDTGRRLFQEGFAIAEASLKTSRTWQAIHLIPRRMVALGTGELSARDLLADAQELVAELENTPEAPPAALMFAYLYASQVTADAEELALCADVTGRGLDLALRCGDVGSERIFRSSALQVSLVSLDPLDVTIALGEKMCADLAGVRSALPLVHGILAAAYAMCDRPAQAQETWAVAAEPRGALTGTTRAFVEIYYCEILVADGRTREGAEAFGHLADSATGVPLLQLELNSNAARFHLYSGDAEAAQQRLIAAWANITASGPAPQFEARLCLLDAVFAALRGDTAKARTLLDQATSRIDSQIGPLARAYYAVDLAAAHALLGSQTGMAAARAQATDAFLEKTATALAGHVNEWLDAVSRLALSLTGRHDVAV